MSGQHTPGPWIADIPEGDDAWNIHILREAAPEERICFMSHDATHENAVGKANARLIAAAPDLLAALQEIAAADEASMVELEAMGLGDVRSPANTRLVELARTAIAKATGGVSLRPITEYRAGEDQNITEADIWHPPKS